MASRSNADSSPFKKMTPRQVANLLVTHLRSFPPAARAKRWGVISNLIGRSVDVPDRKAATKNSKAWKALEREIRDLFLDKGFDAERVTRGGNFAVEDVDVKVKQLPRWQIDGKYRNRHAHHALMAEVTRKYCKATGDVPVVFTKHKGQTGCFATVPGEYLVYLASLIGFPPRVRAPKIRLQVLPPLPDVDDEE